MKSFGLWLIIACIIFGSMTGGYHVYLTKNPRKILVAVDTSYPMKPVWHKISKILTLISQKRYSKFCLITEKSRIHGWSSRLKTDKLTPYAPRNFSKLTDANYYPEIKEACEKFLITNASKLQTKNLTQWKIINLSQR